MFGVNLYKAYGYMELDMFGGMKIAVILTLAIRIIVGIGWWGMFKREGKNPWLAFCPVVGAYIAFRMVCDDFSWAAIFGATTFIAWIVALGVDQDVINACAVVNFIMWWVMALMTAHVYQVPMFFGFLYGALPWLGALIFGFSSIMGNYQGPVVLMTAEQKEAKKKEEKKARKQARKNQKGGSKKKA